MTDSIGNSNSVSRQIYADLRSAYDAYAKNSEKINQTEEEKKSYKNNGQITREAYYNLTQTVAERAKNSVKNETEKAELTEKTIQNQQLNTSGQINNTQLQEKAESKKTEVQNFSLPKSTDTIIKELKRNGMHRSMSPYDVAREYGISYLKAREVLDEANKDVNGFVREYKLPENSTVSYKV